MCLIFLRRLDQIYLLVWLGSGFTRSLVLISVSLTVSVSCLLTWYSLTGLGAVYFVEIQLLYFNMLCRKLLRDLEPFHTGHREALVFSMHIVSTLLPRLLFHTICIFNVNIFFIYGAICCPCYNNMFGVSFWDCSFLNVSSLRTSLFRV